MNDMTTSNAPTVDLAAALDPAALAAWLDYVFADHASNKATLLDRFERFLVVTQGGIDDDVMAGHATDFAKDLKAETTATDATRKRVKDPVLHAQRLIDASAKALTDPLGAATAQVTARITAYLQRKEIAARAAAEEEAKQLALAADAAMEVAAHVHSESAADAAVLALHEAQQAAAMATAKPLELTRTRSQGGSLTGLKETWTYEVTDIAKVPAAYLTVNDAAVKAAIKTGARVIPGLRVFAEHKAMIR